ncbi:glycosyltransferase family 4 protein [Adonisia turfae]|uniref:Glycosyltransferase family 1 protein n=1 Tax=Adonisia turfae CCMR0081 TaxID=2292702 RepID=A0A6M0RDQ6_9CYAN|nr:glycosyltransferase family 4 protein [Adonisia turfae]NEZ54407.1 glycosyltransferase family 1 protein [Adonisia turfae CCMR0081]
MNILIAGPSLEEQGGMGSVQQHIIKGISPYANLKHVVTWDGSSGKPSLWATIMIFSKSVLIFLRELLKTKVDLVHLHVSERGSVARHLILMTIALVFQKPVLLHTHGSEFHLFYNRLPLLAKSLVDWGVQRSFLISLSDSWESWYIEHCSLDPEKSFVLKNPVNFPVEIPQRTNADRVKIVFLGKINQRKGVFDLLHAFSQLQPQLQAQARLIFAGSGDNEELLELARSLDIYSHMNLLGWINTVQRDQLLADASIFLLPSYNEGLPMALLEAMAFGVPPVTTSVGGIPEVVISGVNGIIVNPGDIKNLTEAIATLISQADLRKKMGYQARESVRSLSTENYVKSLLEIYCKITNLEIVPEQYKSIVENKAVNI